MSGPTRGEGRTLLRLSWAVLGACALGMGSLRAETPLPPEVPLEHANVLAQRAAKALRPHPRLVHAQLYRGLGNEAKVWALDFHDEVTGDPITVLAAASRTLPPLVHCRPMAGRGPRIGERRELDVKFVTTPRRVTTIRIQRICPRRALPQSNADSGLRDCEHDGYPALL